MGRPLMTKMHRKKRLSSVLIKPAGPDCNMACTYCFYLEKSALFTETKTHRMSEDILEETVRQVLTQGEPEVSFGWQGGEPTLMGLPFFEKAVELQKKYGRGQSVGNGLQTNGLLIDREWAEFLSQYKFLVGLSLDGPEHIHNRYRQMKNGQGSWSRVVDRAKLLLDQGVATNALTVVNDYSVDFPEEIYVFHKSLGLDYMQFIPCLETHPGEPSQTAPFSAPADKFGPFLCKIFDLWLDDFDGMTAATSIRFFDSLFHIYVDLPPPECTLLKECGVYVVVEHNGDIYSCDFFVDPRWKLGNIMTGRLADMLNSSTQNRFGRLKASLPKECLDCRWLHLCRGGCTKDRLHNPSHDQLNFFCSAYKMFFQHADKKFKELAEEWKRRQMPAHSHPPKSETPRVGRNDPCPCGSGLKYKKCCGST
jgi:uncharacterized protein